MLIEGIKHSNCDDCEKTVLSFKGLIVQSIATSIDALSSGVAFATYNILEALISVAIISVVTFIICFVGIIIGKKFGTKLSNYADLLGGIILIIIGLEIFIKGII